MAYISFQPSDYFNPLKWDGTGASNALTGVGFEPNATWIKSRDGGYQHELYDSVRGVEKYISPNDNDAEATDAEGLNAFGADGFTVGTRDQVNQSSKTYISWNWKAGTTTGVDFSGGDITPSAYSINTTSGFGIYKFAGTNQAATMAHGLGATPGLIIVKRISTTGNWATYHQGTGNTKALVLDTNAVADTSTLYWNDTSPTSTLFSLSTYTNTDATGIVAYVWAEKSGYSKFGSYSGNGNADGTFVYTGFRPAVVICKRITPANNWIIFDDRRNPYNFTNKVLYPSTDGTEDTETTGNGIDIVSNGIKFRGDGGMTNAANDFVYMAWAEFPTISSNDVPGVAR